MNVNIDVSVTAFSRFGSYIAFSRLEGDHAPGDLPAGIWLRSVHGDSAYEVLHLELVENGEAVPALASTTASVLTLRAERGLVEICLPTENTVRVKVRDTTLRITARPFRNHGAIPEPDGNWVFNLARTFHSYRLVPLRGGFSVDAPWTTKHCTHMVAELYASGVDPAEMAIEELSWMRPVQDHCASFDLLARVVQDEFELFCKPFLACPDGLRDTAIEAAYLDWSSVVSPHRLLQRPSMYMSKNWMTNVWAWDHAFNALAVCLTDPDLAWDQLMVIFDHQAENGQIPDFVNDARYLTVFVKPPIHGWILQRMIDFSGPLPPERCVKAYDMLARWTEWWFSFRDPDGDGLPVYWHGNDSGWDNGTVFDVPPPLKSADLAAFLIVQMDVLAKLAGVLGLEDDSRSWRQRADRTLQALVNTLWDGTRFRSISTQTRMSADTSDSVFTCLPIILGKRLQTDVRSALVAEVRRHITDWGLATEHPASSKYEADGYWRGPIWAPVTMIIADGLRESGELELTQKLAERFCRLCRASGFAENFNALTGDPLRDRGYTWTSSVFLVLANKFLSGAAKGKVQTERCMVRDSDAGDH